MTSILQTPQSQATLGLALGVASHWTYFIHGEHHLQAPILFLLACLGPIGLVAWLSLGAQVSVTAAIATSSWVFGSFFAGLFASIATYRLFFHQLCRFPGPRLASISKLYHAYRCGQTNNYQILADLHQTYGPVVRVGKIMNAQLNYPFHPSPKLLFSPPHRRLDLALLLLNH